MEVVTLLDYAQVGLWLLDPSFFSRRKVNMKSFMKTVTLNMIVIKPLQCSFNRNK